MEITKGIEAQRLLREMSYDEMTPEQERILVEYETEIWKTSVEELKATIGIKKSIKEYGIDEKDFLDRLDDMVEQAFDDQCTGANPRYPLMSEIKQMYLNAYYGK